MRLSGMESDEVIEAFKMGTLLAPNHLEYLGASVQDTGNKEPTKLHQRNLHYASVTKQFLVLFSMNIKRQLRVTSSLMSRFLVPTALLALICAGSLVFKDTSISSLNDAETIQMGMLTTASAIRSRDFGDASLATACIVDGSSDSLSHIKICESLALHDPEEGKIPIIVYKPAAQSLKEFLSNDTTRKEILRHLKYNGWINKDGSLPPCVLYYASSWLESIPDTQRSVTVGVLISDDTQGAAVHIYRRALAKVFRVFGISDVENTTALSFIRPVGASVRTGISMQAFFYAICLFPVSYLNDPIEDMSSRVRSHLMSTGMGLFAYWMNTFAMHWIQYALCFMSAVALLMISEAYRSAYLTLMAFLPAYIFGIVSNLLTIYAIAAVTRTRSTIVSVFCNMFVVIMPLAITHISNSIALQLLVWLVPPAAPLGLIYSCLAYLFYKREYYNSPSGSALPGLMESINKNPAIFYALLAMPVHIVILSGIICLAENSSIIRVTFTGVCCSGALDNATYESNSEMDEGARNEAERVLVAPLNKRNVLEVRNLRKTYANGVHAVRGVTYGAMTDEIFGLLGANGAGKSTSMSVIVGEEAATEGVCKVRLHSNTWMLSREAAQIGAIGYCPQHNPLFNSITVAEHIRFYADIRGLNSIEAERQTNSLITSLGLAQHWNTEAGQLSAGSKRRLCLAIALLGDPALIVIDEASTGVDPENKRFIWGAIRRMVHKKRSVMVTTHSMEEVEALCSRVGIMNKGRMISVGTVQQLRSRHGDAYTLDLLLEPVTESAIKQRRHSIKTAVLEQFKGAQTQEDLGLGLVMQFSVPKSAVRSLSDALRWLAANQSRLGVSYWAFYQMSLDQVFVKLVKSCDEMAQKASKGAL
ncbi:hypothetical protein BOX15_Mlig003143g2 [Macrostomum lignano]|nr:hypothetical protein BOX15_Mlig003143g2 [Macrostomum lignano]